MEVFAVNHAFPFSKMLTFYRKEPFDLEASYAKNVSLPLKDGFIGRFSIKDVVPSKEGESSKIKVKVRLDIHGVLNVVNASLVEKLATAAEPEAETMEVEGQDDKTKEATPDAASENSQGTEESSGSQEKPSGEEPMDTTTAESPESKDQQDASSEAKNAKESKSKKDNGGPAKKKKQQVKTVELRVETSVPALTPAELQEALEKELQMVIQDRLEKEKGVAKNAVEGYVYDMRDKIYGELERFITEEAREKFSAFLEETEEWLYEDGENQSKKVYQDKLAAMKKIGDPVETRYSEFTKRPAAFDELGKSLQQIKKILELCAQKDEKYDHIEEEEIKKVEKAVAAKDEWLNNKWNAQNKLADHQDPAVYASMILSEKKLLEDTCYTILNKPKPKPKAEPPPPPKEEEKKEEGNGDSNKEEKMDQEGESTEKTNEPQGEGEKKLDPDMEID